MWVFTIMAISHKFVIYLIFSKLDCAIGSQNYLIYKTLMYACFGFQFSPSYYVLSNAQTKTIDIYQKSSLYMPSQNPTFHNSPIYLEPCKESPPSIFFNFISKINL